MTEIDNFIRKVEAEVLVTLDSGILPSEPKQEGTVLERLSKKYPELGINLELEKKILIYARIFFNSHNN